MSTSRDDFGIAVRSALLQKGARQKFSLFFLIIIASENSQKLFLSFNQLIISDNIFQEQNISPFISVTGTMFAFFSILLLNFGDYARYAKDKNHLRKGNLSLILNLILFSLFSVSI